MARQPESRYHQGLKKNPHAGSAAARSQTTGSRAEVLHLLARGVGTVQELAKKLRLTRNAVRFHLSSLQRAGLARRAGVEQGKRRPHIFYEPTQEAKKRVPNAYKDSFNQLLAELKHRYARRTIIAILRSAGGRLARQPVPSKRLSLAQRSRRAAQLLQNLGASITVERQNGAFSLQSRGCPLAELVKDHPEVCEMVEHFLARSAGTPIRQICERGATPRCRFAVGTVPRLKQAGGK